MKFRKFIAVFTLGFAIGPVAVELGVVGCEREVMGPIPLSSFTENRLAEFEAHFAKLTENDPIINCGPRICPVDSGKIDPLVIY